LIKSTIEGFECGTLTLIKLITLLDEPNSLGVLVLPQEVVLVIDLFLQTADLPIYRTVLINFTALFNIII
jgi:hypothetical protein